jgi:hypothetical protein
VHADRRGQEACAAEISRVPTSGGLPRRPVFEAGRRHGNHAPPPHIVAASLVTPMRIRPDPGSISCLTSSVHTSSPSGDGVVTWSSLRPRQPEAVIRFDVVSDGHGGTDLSGTRWSTSSPTLPGSATTASGSTSSSTGICAFLRSVTGYWTVVGRHRESRQPLPRQAAHGDGAVELREDIHPTGAGSPSATCCKIRESAGGTPVGQRGDRPRSRSSRDARRRGPGNARVGGRRGGARVVRERRAGPR